jgi:hypothetical protein
MKELHRSRSRRTVGSRIGYAMAASVIVIVLAAIAALTSRPAQASGAAAAPVNSSAPGVSGTAAVGQTLTATPGSWSGATPITFSYHWKRCDANGANCVFVSGATLSTYHLGSSDVGFRLRAHVTATNSAGQASADSAATAAVVASLAPKNTAEPTISGTAVVGQRLTGTTGTWTGTPTITYAYQWARCPGDGGATDGSNCTTVSGATGTRYTLTAADVGARMRIRVKATNGAGSTTVASNATATVTEPPTQPKNTSEPVISGQPSQGSVLTTTTGTWTGTSPITFAYQWVRCGTNGGRPDGSNCASISGAASTTYTLQRADVGHRLRVRVTGTNSAGSAVVASNPTATVKAAPQLPPGAIRLPNGQVSIPVTSVSLPNQLIIDSVAFSPNPVRSRQVPITIRVHVSDSRGYVVRDAIVFLRSVPLLTSTPLEQTTGQDGWLTVQVLPRADFPLKAGYNVQFFVRARKNGDNPLAGVSARRLVQVATSG